MSNTCGGVWLNRVGQNVETNEEHGEDCAEERFQLARIEFDRYGEPSKYRELYYQYIRWIRIGISLHQEKQFIF